MQQQKEKKRKEKPDVCTQQAHNPEVLLLNELQLKIDVTR